MKNIHVLSTDKPSRLYKFANELYLDTIPKEYYKKYNIYITSDEEIKEGDWYAYFIVDKVSQSFTTKLDCVVKADLNKTNEYLVEPFSKYCKKIILTTDFKLAPDVQKIDDEFLEWFVKNPSCEEVEVKKGFRDGTSYGYNFLEYKIIIPKEEPKFISGQPFLEKADKVIVIHRPKQETLEEAAENYTEFWLQNKGLLIKDAFAEGAKWQAKRMFTEDEVYMIWNAGQKYWETSGESTTFEELIEKLKKR